MQQVRQAYEDGSFERTEELLDKYIPIADETDLRGFEWYHWWRVGHLHINEFSRHGPKGAMSVSPDRKRVAVTGWGGWIHIFDTESMQHVLGKKLDSVEGMPRLVAFSPDGKYLAARGYNQISLWQISDWKQVTNYLPRGIRTFAFSTNDSLLASSSHQGTIRLWNTETRKYDGDPMECKASVSALAFSPDGKYLIATVDEEETHERKPIALVWDVAKRTLKTQLSGRQQNVNVVAWTSRNSGSVIATGSPDGRVRLWDGSSFREMDTLTTNGRVKSLSFSSDGSKLVATTSGDNAVYVWETDSSRLISTIKGHSLGVDGAMFVDDGDTLWSSRADHSIKIWDLSRSEPSERLPGSPRTLGSPKTLTFGPDNKTLRNSPELDSRYQMVSGIAV
jgi:WD40 repeat protein